VPGTGDLAPVDARACFGQADRIFGSRADLILDRPPEAEVALSVAVAEADVFLQFQQETVTENRTDVML
jgi:hypothetical protein